MWLFLISSEVEKDPGYTEYLIVSLVVLGYNDWLII